MNQGLKLLLLAAFASAGCAANVGGEEGNAEGVSLDEFRDEPVDHDGVSDKELQNCQSIWVNGVFKMVCPAEFRQTTSRLTLNTGFQGEWQFPTNSPQATLANGVPFDMCPANQFVYRFDVRQETSQGGGDDTALNSVILHCFDRNSPTGATLVGSAQGIYGTWTGFATPSFFNTTNPMVGLQVKYENESAADDVMITLVRGKFLNGEVITPPSNATVAGWGAWLTTAHMCPAGQAICGMNTRVEASVGSGDDSMLNAIKIACCAF